MPDEHNMRKVLEWVYHTHQGCWGSSDTEPPRCTEAAGFAEADAQLRRGVLALGLEQI